MKKSEEIKASFFTHHSIWKVEPKTGSAEVATKKAKVEGELLTFSTTSESGAEFGKISQKIASFLPAKEEEPFPASREPNLYALNLGHKLCVFGQIRHCYKFLGKKASSF